MKNIKLFIADTSQTYAKDLKENLSENITIIGHEANGKKVVEMIQQTQPDIVLLDIVLEEHDGFEVLEDLKNIPNKPKVIVNTTLTHEGFISKAIALGADYFIVKPVSFDCLEKRILELSSGETSAPTKEVVISQKPSKNRFLEEKITNIFITVGIPAHIKGYQYLREAIKMSIENPEVINSITKKLYPSIAQRFETSASKVERAIRHAIEVAWNRGKIENINSVFQIKVYDTNEKPTNGEFIALVADKMIIEGF